MKNYPKKVRETLNSILLDMAKTPWLYAKDPIRDFTRKRKLPFEKVIATLICMGGGALNKELTPSSVESLIRKYITAVVPERSRPRCRQREFRIRFVYRVA